MKRHSSWPLLLSFTFGPSLLAAQGYVTYFTGNPADAITQPSGGVCLMGGATEHDEAMRWFLQRADGGDVLVIRASGSNGYNNYLFSELGITVNSVETIVFQNASAAHDAYVHERIQRAEAIWIAGGDQWNYVSYWRGTPVDSLINLAIAERNIVIGGTSAGMAILGGIYFTAQNGSVSSSAALASPFGPNMTLSDVPFIQVPGLEHVVTDTHYDNPDRRGRHTVFLARAIGEMGHADALGIACNDYTSVCIGNDGLARVFGEWPDYPEFAYFLKANCLTTGIPEVLQPGTSLTWDHEGMAVKVCKVPGTMQGNFHFDMTDQRSTEGGSWEDWHVLNGQLDTSPGAAPDCTMGLPERSAAVRSYIDMQSGRYVIDGLEGGGELRLMDATGRLLYTQRVTTSPVYIEAPVEGMQLLEVRMDSGMFTFRLVPL